MPVGALLNFQQKNNLKFTVENENVKNSMGRK
jgi:hypothetical protein